MTINLNKKGIEFEISNLPKQSLKFANALQKMQSYLCNINIFGTLVTYCYFYFLNIRIKI